jgi:hypothetical protein
MRVLKPGIAKHYGSSSAHEAFDDRRVDNRAGDRRLAGRAKNEAESAGDYRRADVVVFDEMDRPQIVFAVSNLSPPSHLGMTADEAPTPRSWSRSVTGSMLAPRISARARIAGTKSRAACNKR